MSVSLSGLFICLFLAVYHVYLINLRLWYKGTPKYLGECQRLEIWVMENMTGCLYSRRKTVGGNASAGVGKSQ